jgi:NAD(P)-dependent dehydrogenase (short-subunit alcohol dehydrogenase family)
VETVIQPPDGPHARGLAQYDAAVARDPSVAELGPERYFADKARRLIPLGRGQEPQDIANAVAFLASDRAGYLQGAVLDVDGGLTRTL